MEPSSIIAGKMENIAAIFQNARKTASQQKDLNELVRILETSDHEFISIAFEGASMEIAQKDFTEDPTLQEWFAYLKIAEKHAAQIFIGLGWAVAAEKRTDLSFLDKVDPGMIFRMWDGCGYFDGKLRQRQVIKGLARLNYIPEKNFRPYDQGLGRCIWYNSLGETTKVSDTISGFPVNRQPDLWRGIGIAASYVGGCNENIFNSLLSLAGNNKIQLGIGAAMVAKSRTQAECLTEDLEKACIFLCNMTTQEAMKATIEADANAANSFDNWLSHIEKNILNAFSMPAKVH
jgi:enediyne biosynthesis protein E3